MLLWRVGLALSLLVSVATGGLRAQVRLRGIAYDSLAGRPLAGATILLQGFPRTALTDSVGAFVLDSVPLGRYLVILTHPELDEIGLPSVITKAALSEGGSRDIAIAVPSIGTLWRRLCGQDSVGPDSGIVFGTVRDTDTDSLVAGVYVDVAWPALVKLETRHVRLEKRSASAWTDGTGSYRVCGVGTEIRVRAQAHTSAVATGIVEFMVAPRPVARRDFTLSRAPKTGGDSARTRQLRGQVRSEGGLPIPSAMVTVEEADSAVTDASGRFRLTHLPGGTQWLRVRAVGYAALEQSVDVRSLNEMRTLELRGIALMDTITVLGTGRMVHEMREFEERRRVGFGYSLRGEEIKKAATLRSVMQQLPSLIVGPRVVRTPTVVRGDVVLPASADEAPGTFNVYMRRDAIGSAYCLANLYVDGMKSSWEQLGGYIPEDIVGVEVYPRQSLVPIRFQNISSGCGAVLVWTKSLR